MGMERRSAGIVLSVAAILPTMGAVVIVPVLPLFAKHFANVPGIAILVTIVLTLPALCIGLFSPVAGAAADRFGRRPLLIAALIAYAIAGVAPAFLDSIPLIIASRVFVGICEAFVMTCCTTLVGDYYAGASRERWLSYQSAFVATGATLLFIVGGALGTIGWRAPFFAYSLALVLAAVAAKTLREPDVARALAPERPFSWAPIRGFMLLAVFSAIGFYVVPVQLGFLLGAVGVAAPFAIGLIAASTNIAVAAGALSFRFLARFGDGGRLAIAATFAGIGFAGIASSQAVAPMLVSFAINGFGMGLLLPTTLNLVMQRLPFDLRGRGTGAYMGAFFIGQFLSPLVVAAIGKNIGGLTNTVAVFGYVALIAAAAGFIVSYVGRRRQRALSGIGESTMP